MRNFAEALVNADFVELMTWSVDKRMPSPFGWMHDGKSWRAIVEQFELDRGTITGLLQRGAQPASRGGE